MSDWPIIIPLSFFTVYAITGGIEFGLPLLGLWPSQKTNQLPQRYLGPAWEITNVYLVLGVTAVMTLYPRGLPQLAAQLQSLWLIIGALLALRAILMLSLLYSPAPGSPRRWALGGVSLLLPVALMQSLAVLATGSSHFWDHPGLSLSLAALAIATTLALTAGFMAATAPALIWRRLGRDALVITALLGMLTLVLLPGASLNWSALGALEASVIISALLLRRRRWRWRHLAAAASLCLGTAAGLALWLQPYLMRPTLTLTDAATNPISAAIIAGGAGLILLSAALALPLLYPIIIRSLHE